MDFDEWWYGQEFNEARYSAGRQAWDYQQQRIAALEAALDARRKESELKHHYQITLEQRIEALEAVSRWREYLPGNPDECMEIAVKLKVGWYRCIGYVLQDLSITDFDQNYVGYEWGAGCLWRPVCPDAELAALLPGGE